ncbi:AraC family transcriptional regulator [Rhodanobacter sp. A1T4]|jgi:AraC-like DNA-binding protein|uniref:helix-turn-helix domain-containing protein n=1 Tax=Rhodanobacter sp. A1T4 TaxID=2723087 RepID=UPI00160AE8A6|nr:AraC family transcriptional regulator [Rhodanobacter sp. A1T4]MBB6248869.1 AraC-like DNA-binding protein [Rhodanobacter sp. A1T4]
MSFAKAPIGHQCHDACQRLDRHCHDGAFATVVLSGGYTEAGDEGRRTVVAGDVLIHRAYESHLDCFSRRGAEVLILPVATNDSIALFGSAADPDRLLRLARRSPQDAWLLLVETLQPSEQRHQDWPDLLAEQLRQDVHLSLRRWAEDTGLRPESVSRGFQRAYGSSPKSFRARSRTRAAVQRICESRQPLCDIAVSLGFADQAHMSRAVAALTGFAPSHWRQTGLPLPNPMLG